MFEMTEDQWLFAMFAGFIGMFMSIALYVLIYRIFWFQILLGVSAIVFYYSKYKHDKLFNKQRSSWQN